MDVHAASTYDAAHMYVAHAKNRADLPAPTLTTIFEVVTAGRVYRVHGAALQRWITQRRQELKGPKGMLFRQRPGLDSQ